MTRFIMLLAGLLLMLGCDHIPPIKAYGGAQRSSDEVAIIKCKRNITVSGIDNRQISYTTRDIELLPGEHTLDVCAIFPSARCRKDIKFRINVEANRVYYIDAIINYQNPKIGNDYTWSPIINEGIILERISDQGETIKETYQDYYSAAKRMSDTAKDQQILNKWAEATKSWGSATEYAYMGKLSLDTILTLEKNYSNALAATCQYPLAIEHLKAAKKLDDTYNWSRDSTLLALARINLITDNLAVAKTQYDIMRSTYNNTLMPNEIKLVEEILSSNNRTSDSTAAKLRDLDKQLQYGAHCTPDT